DEVFTNKDDPQQHIALGSVKSQIGHLKAGAGIAGFIKVSLALHHKVLPPTINITKPNPKLNIEDTAFYLNTEPRPWLPAEDGSPRRAGVSAFGFGGTNFHFAVEEYKPNLLPKSRLNTVVQSSLIHAESAVKLAELCQQHLGKLKDENSLNGYQEFLTATKINGCPENHVRVGFVSENRGEATKLLELAAKTVSAKPDSDHWEMPQGIYYRNASLNIKGKVVALFSGQGSQYPGMGGDLTSNFTEYMNAAGKMDGIFIKAGKGRLSDRVHPIPVFEAVDRSFQERELQQTQYAQPAIGTFSVGSYKIFEKAGFKPDFVAGHSFGELTALWAAGVIGENDCFKLAFARGQAMAAPDDDNFDAGSMLAVVGDISGLTEMLKQYPDVVKANNNSKTQVVLAGPGKDIVKIQELLQNKDAIQGKEYKAIPLPVSAAFHTPLVEHAQKPFADVVQKVNFKAPTIPVYSNTTGDVHPKSGKAIKKTLKDHILKPVNFKDEIETIYNDGGSIFIEFGPKNVLTKLVDNILDDKPHLAVAVNASNKKSADRQLRQAVLQLAVAGLSLTDVDPYMSEMRITNTEKPSPMKIELGAPNYVSDKTAKAFEDSLNDGFKITQAKPIPAVAPPPVVPIVTNKAVEKPVETTQAVTPVAEAPSSVGVPKAKSIMTEDSNYAPVQSVNSINADRVAESIENSLTQFYRHQNETLKVHEQYLESPKEYSQTFATLMQQQMSLLADNPGLEMPASIERSMTMFHQHQSDTLRVHERYLDNQADATSQTLDVMKEQYSVLTGISAGTGSLVGANAVTISPSPVKALPSRVVQPTAVETQIAPKVVQQPVQRSIQEPIQQSIQPPVKPAVQQVIEKPAEQPVVTSNTNFAAEIKASMLEVVAEKTGYPVEMLEFDMDMEADLGIDSIKRVEILGTVQEEFPQLPEMNPDELAELRTLGQIVDYMEAQIGDAQPTTVASTTRAPVPAAPAASGDTTAVVAQLTDVMLKVVAEKTGYPTEMLDLDMDMEADLGIDSIKRVEILGTVQEEFSDLPEMNPDELSELRTLGQIIDYMKSHLGSVSAVTVGVAVAAVASPIPAEGVAGIDVATLTETMLSVVAEKTGYPVEMLDLSMDMEADLGIDSIKRVEILGTVQEAFPDFPELNPDEMSELRTLGEIVDNMNSQLVASAGTAAPATVATSIATSIATTAPVTATPTATSTASVIDVSKLTDVMLAVVAEKTGYPVEMLELDMDMEADLGIDSIKRVEILGTVQEEFPGLPEMNPEAMAEMRTLGQIVDYMKSTVESGGGEAISTVTAAVAETATGVSVDLESLKDTMMNVVAEKTGYPVEMLELDMDMEADLGIDSIKRVEILGTVQESFPALPEMNPDILAELRTLGEIVDSMEHQLNGGSASAAPANVAVQTEESPVVKKPLSPGVSSGVPRVKLISNPDQLLLPIAGNRSCLITDDGTTLTTELADALCRVGHTVVVLRFPLDMVAERSQLGEGIAQVELKNMEEDHLVDVLNVVNEEMGQVANFVHLDASYQVGEQGGLDYSERKKLVLQHVFLLAKHLKPALNTPADVDGSQARNTFITVAHLDGRLGYGDGKFSVVGGGFFGLTKTMNLEWPAVFCRAIDIHRNIAGSDAAAIVLAEMLAADINHVEVGYTKEGRATLEAMPVTTIPAAGNQIDGDSVFLVSGGAKGVTSQCVIKLAQAYQSKFILLGRSEYTGEDPAWAADCTDETELKKRAMAVLKEAGEKPTPVKVQGILRPVFSQREISSVLNAISVAGGTALYLSCDVTDATSVQQQLAAATTQLGAITGVIHGAGVLADKLIEKKTIADFEAVYSTKVNGLGSILQNVDEAQLKHLILFSSAAGYFGNAAQSDYSVANEILNKTAMNFKARYPDCHVISFDWGPWDGGMVTAQLKKLFEARNIEVIPMEGGTQLFVDNLSSESNDANQILVGSTMEFDVGESDSTLKTHRLARSITIEDNPFLLDHTLGDNPVVPMVFSASWMVDAVEGFYPGYHFSSMADLRLYKGIVLDESVATHYFLDIEELEKGDTLRIKTSIWSEADKRVNHYAAEISLSRQSIPSPVTSAMNLGEAGGVDGPILYCDGTLFHGPKFQLIKSLVNCSNKQLTLLCKAPSNTGATLGQFTSHATNPLIADLNFQAMLVWVRKDSDCGSLPSSVDKIEQFETIPEGQEFYLTLEVKETTLRKMVANILLHDVNGKIYSRFTGAKVTVSKELNQLFQVST
ncbi:MAG: SDR family NAD(P)-dependent oxidoreductase, partial [Pseudomonadales bacterium]|nr:SDR family NAD(P)-dependent oxidoreductase [Pseudomonadales bacterium]